MNNYSAYGITDDGTPPTRPAWMEDMSTYRTPQQDWAALMSQVQPFWQTRAPLADLGQRLQARYMLGAPDMAEYGAIEPTFSQFLQGYPGQFTTGATPQMYSAGYNPNTGVARDAAGELAELRSRAQQAANAATMAPGAYLSGVTPGTPEFNRRAWYASQFGSDAENAGSNQLAVANLLATRRPAGTGTGAYTGRMGDAIRRAMGNLYQQRMNLGNPQENFLNWYLSQTGA